MYNFVYIGKTDDRVTTVEHHKHATWELIYVRCGTGVFFFGDTQQSFRPGDIIIVPPNQMHYEHSEDGYGNYFLFFQDFYLADNTGAALRAHDLPGQPIGSLLLLLHQTNGGGAQQLTAALFECLHQYIQTLLPNNRKNGAVEQLKREIEERYTDPSYSPELKDSDGNYCEDYVRRLFKKCYGMTPLRYMIMLRINTAKQLIHEREQSSAWLKQIAYDSGYSDYYYFSRQFKQEMGLSPREWYKLSAYPSSYQ